jgi:hypothetical protein
MTSGCGENCGPGTLIGVTGADRRSVSLQKRRLIWSVAGVWRRPLTAAQRTLEEPIRYRFR